MIKKCFGLAIIFLIAISSIGCVAADTCTITVDARTQKNDGWGTVWFINSKDEIYSRIVMGPGETKTWDISTQFHNDLDNIQFHSNGGRELYDTNVYNISGFKKDQPNGSAVFHVNFYNETMYFNNYYVYPSYSWTGDLIKNCPVMDASYGVRFFPMSGRTIHGWW
ncbi:MAG: hypothetical protein LBD03_01045 [Methanobrevibacter sp.]|jgi:hypothetical protein|nr:hypothetical protein [Candidatus Methanovirga procula]